MRTDVYERLQLVRKHFPELTEPALQLAIAEVSTLHDFSAETRIMDFGSYIKMVPLVIEGSIKVVREDQDKGNELFLYYLRSGETCSMSFSCCMANKRSDIRTTAEEDTRLLGIPIKYVDQWMTSFGSWKNFVMRSYDQRMRELIATIDSIAFQKMDERLLNYLQQKSAAIESSLITTTHQQIAHDLNASREAISRLLKQLEKMGSIKLGRNKIELLRS